jgi:hypothetical protein
MSWVLVKLGDTRALNCTVRPTHIGAAEAKKTDEAA